MTSGQGLEMRLTVAVRLAECFPVVSQTAASQLTGGASGNLVLPLLPFMSSLANAVADKQTAKIVIVIVKADLFIVSP